MTLGITVELLDAMLVARGIGGATVGYTVMGGYRRGYAIEAQKGRQDTWDFVSWVTSHGDGTEGDRKERLLLNDDEPFYGDRAGAVIALQRRLLELAQMRLERDLVRDKLLPAEEALYEEVLTNG